MPGAFSRVAKSNDHRDNSCFQGNREDSCLPELPGLEPWKAGDASKEGHRAENIVRGQVSLIHQGQLPNRHKKWAESPAWETLWGQRFIPEMWQGFQT